MKNTILWISLLVSVIITAQNKSVPIGNSIENNTENNVVKSLDDDTENSTENDVENAKFILFKKKAHASYYHDKFNGRKMASGKRFDNNKLTVAHKNFPFGTKLRITNEKNNKSVIVEVTDRGPFVKGREVDMSRRAFMNIAPNSSCGLLYVKIEVVKN